MNIKQLGRAALLSFAVYSGINAQSMPLDNKRDTNTSIMNFPKVPKFNREYDPSVSMIFVGCEGPVSWKSKKYLSKEHHNITEIRGHVDIDVNILSIGLEKIYVGFITRMDEQNKTIETIIYNNGPDTSKITAYDKELALKEDVDLTNATSMSHEWADYKNNYLEDLEFKIKKPLDNAVGFQEGYFLIPKRLWADTTMNIHYKSEIVQITTHTREEDGRKYISADITKPDPQHPGQRKNVIEKINSLTIVLDEYDLPIKIVAEMKGPLGILVDAEAEYKK
jgi:hypothetical protein